MKRILVGVIFFTMLTFGTALAAPGSTVQSSAVGIINIQKVMAASPKIKALQDQLNQKGQELSKQLEAEKPNLTPEQYKEKQQAVYKVFSDFKLQLEGQIDAGIKQAVEQVAKEKRLTVVLYKDSIFYGGVDISSDVINKMN